MFAATKEKDKSNGLGAPPPMSASDQKIEYRPFASAMKVLIDGDEFNIRPPSFHVSNIIKQFKLDYMKKMSKQRDVSLEIGKKLDEELKRAREAATEKGKAVSKQTELEVADDAANMENVEALVNVYEELQSELFKIQDMSDREMLRLVQLIILDGKDKKWREDHETFPPDSVLEKAVPYQRLYRHADVAELQVLLDVYDQMNRPEYARKNFQKLSPLT